MSKFQYHIYAVIVAFNNFVLKCKSSLLVKRVFFLLNAALARQSYMGFDTHTHTHTHIHSINPISASNLQLDIEHVNKLDNTKHTCCTCTAVTQ